MYQDYLKNIDEENKHKVKAKILLRLAPKEYNHFVTILLYERTQSTLTILA